MADRTDKSEGNVPGKFYVDRTCISACFCVGVAPDHFVMSDGGYAVISKQPESADEEKAVREAMEGCPVMAIGDDG